MLKGGQVLEMPRVSAAVSGLLDGRIGSGGLMENEGEVWRNNLNQSLFI